jgi:hypothetical protein
MFLARLGYEIKLMGKRFFLTPLLIVVAASLMALLLSYLKTNPVRFLTAIPEIILPLAAGVIVCMQATQDGALELHLSLPDSYQQTSLLRWLLVLLWTGGIALVTISAMAGLHLLYPPQFTASWPLLVQWFALQLVWLAPLLWMMALGLCMALLIRSGTGSSALLAGIWLIEIVFKDMIVTTSWLRPLLLFPSTLLVFPATQVQPDDFNTYWLTTRFEILGSALFLLIVGGLLLRNHEALLKGSTQE